MSKITSYQANISNELNRVQSLEQQVKIEKQNVIKQKEQSDSVVNNIKPELDSINAANSLANKLASQLQFSPDNALSAQGDLDEAKILALLQEDE